MTLKSRFYILLALGIVALNAPVNAEPASFFYGGDKTPSESPYANWFTTLGPGHPTGSYFTGTTWGSDGDVLTMHTQHPGDFSGATSQGIWFGRTDNYGDPSVGLNFDTTANGNRVEARMALGLNSGEWSLYWLDANGYYANLYMLNDGFHVYTAAQDVFVPLATMTSFHTYASHIQNGQVSYYLDDALVAEGTASIGGINNFLIIGDASAGSVSGYGTLRVDSVNIIVNAGAAPVPEPTTSWLLAIGILTGGAMWRRERKQR